MKICLILPAYNEAKTIKEVILQARRFIQPIIVVDDGSIDTDDQAACLSGGKSVGTSETARIAQRLGTTVIQHKTNLGKGMALRTGFDWALRNKYEIVMTMDSDGQHDPLDIPRFLDKLQRDNPDIIVGERSIDRSNMPLHRRLNNKLVSNVGSWLCEQNIADFQCGYRLIKAEVLRTVELETMRYETESELLVKAGRLGFRIETIPIKTIYSGQVSNVKPIREIYFFTKLLFACLRERTEKTAQNL